MKTPSNEERDKNTGCGEKKNESGREFNGDTETRKENFLEIPKNKQKNKQKKNTHARDTHTHTHTQCPQPSHTSPSQPTTQSINQTYLD
jgi:hypothetical protein